MCIPLRFCPCGKGAACGHALCCIIANKKVSAKPLRAALALALFLMVEGVYSEGQRKSQSRQPYPVLPAAERVHIGRRPVAKPTVELGGFFQLLAAAARDNGEAAIEAG